MPASSNSARTRRNVEPAPHQLRRAARKLRAGGLVAHPTEGVWGLACDPLNPQAVMRLLAAKRRDAAKGLILIAHDAKALAPFVDAKGHDAWQRACADWPGPVTWLLPANAQAPWWLTGAHASIALRVSAHAASAALCRAFGGALVSTSANVAGRPPAVHGWQVRARFGAHVDALVAGALDTPGIPSAIRDGRSGAVIRGAKTPP